MMGEKRARVRYRKVLKVGVGCISIIVVLVAITVALNFERLRSAHNSRVEALARLQAVRSAIQSREATPDVAVFEKHRLGPPAGANLPSSILSVELVKPPFLQGLSDEGLREKALEIAQIAWEAYPSPRDFEAVEIVLTSRRSGFVTFGSKRHFLIRADEMTPHTDESGGAVEETEPVPTPSS